MDLFTNNTINLLANFDINCLKIVESMAIKMVTELTIKKSIIRREICLIPKVEYLFIMVKFKTNCCFMANFELFILKIMLDLSINFVTTTNFIYFNVIDFTS